MEVKSDDLEFIIDEEDLEGLEVEELSTNVYVSESRKDLVRDTLKQVELSYIQLICLNRTISIFLSRQGAFAKDDVMNKVKQISFMEDSSEDFETSRDMLERKLKALKENIEREEQLRANNIPTQGMDGMTVMDLSILVSVAPVSSRSYIQEYASVLEANHGRNMEAKLTYEEKLKVAKIIENTLFHCNPQDVELNSGLSSDTIISDVSVDPEADIDTSSKVGKLEAYGIPTFNVKKKLRKLQDQIKQFEGDINPLDTTVPTIYIISLVELISDSYQNKEFYRITLELFYSTDENMPEKKIIYRPKSFENELHLIGVNSVRIKGISESLSESYERIIRNSWKELKYDSAPTEDDEDDIPDNATDKIIGVPYYILGKNDNGTDFIAIGMNSDLGTSYTPEALAKCEARGYSSYMDFLIEANAKRLRDEMKVPIWYTCVTASTSATPDLIKEEKINSFIGGSSTRYTALELLEMAKSMNTKRHILTHYKTSNGMVVDERLDPNEIEASTVFYTEDKKLMDRYKKLNGDLKFYYTDYNTANRSIIMQAIIQTVNKPVRSRLDIERIFNENKATIINSTLPIIFSKYVYDRENIGTIFKGKISKEGFYELISTEQYRDDPNLEVNLDPFSVLDSVSMVYRLRAWGFKSQDFTGDKIVKERRITKDDVEREEFTKEEFVDEFIKIMENPCSLLEYWGIVPFEKTLKPSSNSFGNVATALLEAYQIYSILLGSNKFASKYIDSGSFIESEDVKNNMYDYKYNTKLAPAKFNTYTGVKGLGLTKKYYESYKEYLTKVINHFFINQKHITTNFDGGMIVNAYIQAMAEGSKNNKSLPFRLFFNSEEIDKSEFEVSDQIDMILERLDNREDVSLDEVFETFGVKSKLSEDDTTRLAGLLNDTKSIMGLSNIPLTQLLASIESYAEEGEIETFSEEQLNSFLIRLGLNSTKNSQVNFDVDIDTKAEDYPPTLVKESVEGKANTYVIRDKNILENVLSSKAFDKWVVGLMENKTDEDWTKSFETIKELINKETFGKVKRLQSTVKSVVNKVSTFIEDTDYLTSSLESYMNIIAPTEVDAYLLLKYINKAITNLMPKKSSLLNLERIKLESVTAEQIKAIEEESTKAKRDSDYAILLAPFLPIEDVLKADEKLREVNAKILQLLDDNQDKEVYIDPRTQKKNIALFRKYLQTGNSKYKEGVDIDTIPFDLLTLDMPAKYKLNGPYSKKNLVVDHALVDLNDEKAVLEIMSSSYMTILEMVLESYPDFEVDCPRAIRQYIFDNRKTKLK